MDLDAPTIFYLKHEAQITEWYELRKRVADAAGRFFESLPPDIDDLSTRLEGDPSMIPVLDIPGPHVMLVRDAWMDPAGKVARCGIGIGWGKSGLTFKNPWTGIWVNRSLDGGLVLREALRASLSDLGKEHTLRRGVDYALWRYEPPAAPNYWEDLDTLRRYLLDRITTLWDAFRPGVDQIVGITPETVSS